MAIQVQVETITPDVAAELLGKSEKFKNRTIRKQHVARLARDMQNGAWQLNGESIKINDAGEAIDGQHRLRACIIAGVPFDTTIARGVPSSAYKTIDHGTPRKFKDTLTIQGYRYSVNLAAATSSVWNITKGSLTSGSLRPTDTELSEVLVDWPGLIEWTSLITNDEILRRISMGAALPTALFTLFSSIDADLAEKLHSSLSKGIGLDSAHDPALLLRNLLLRHSGRVSVHRPTRSSIAAWYIKTWNDMRSGNRRKLLVWKSTESFPDIDGRNWDRG